MNVIRFAFFLLGSCVSVAALAANIPVPVATDSRIKTLVYNENDVFNILTHYGYQSNIEFGQGEEIQTVSVGDRVGWQVIPAGRRLFLRAMEDSSRTNMTVVTNRHTYQFDLTSAPYSQNPQEELVYVVRFFYPDQQKIGIAAPSYSDVAPGMMSPAPTAPALSPAPAAPVGTAVPALTPVSASSHNYDYTYTGDDQAAPLKLFDDGKTTYFKFSDPNLQPVVARVTPEGKEVPVMTYVSGEYIAVDTVAPRLILRSANGVVCVYNERYKR